MNDDTKKCCGTCRYHEFETEPSCPDWVCTNGESEYWADYTGYADSCPDWEGRS